MPLRSKLILSVSMYCFDDKGTRPNETYPETGDDIVVFGGGCGFCNVSLRKTRPSPSAPCRGGRAERGASAAPVPIATCVIRLTRPKKPPSKRPRLAAAAVTAGKCGSRATPGRARTPMPALSPRSRIQTRPLKALPATRWFRRRANISAPTRPGAAACGAVPSWTWCSSAPAIAGGGNLASAYARYGTRVSGPQVGAIAVMGRNGGGHVGVVSGIDAERQSDRRIRQYLESQHRRSAHGGRIGLPTQPGLRLRDAVTDRSVHA